MPPRHPIVDTGPLFDFLLWRFSLEPGRPSYTLTCLTTDFDRLAIRWYFTTAKPLTTCPQVILEIHHLARALRNPRLQLGDFWGFAQRTLADLGLSEELIKLFTMDGEVLGSFGPTDTALLHIARDLSPPGRPVLTDDRKLAGYCRTNQVGVLMLPDVLNLWQEYGGT